MTYDLKCNKCEAISEKVMDKKQFDNFKYGVLKQYCNICSGFDLVVFIKNVNVKLTGIWSK